MMNSNKGDDIQQEVLAGSFRQAATALTKLYKDALAMQQQSNQSVQDGGDMESFKAGYQSCLQDIIQLILSVPMTDINILGAAQQQLYSSGTTLPQSASQRQQQRLINGDVMIDYLNGRQDVMMKEAMQRQLQERRASSQQLSRNISDDISFADFEMIRQLRPSIVAQPATMDAENGSAAVVGQIQPQSPLKKRSRHQ
ncbi:hypothetical protein MIR68_010009 [Amoeboaphelidium protococcarum]|nr:hypothetical protein MIR68_010009 [Amoeboaphelidium protococcarum]